MDEFTRKIEKDYTQSQLQEKKLIKENLSKQFQNFTSSYKNMALTLEKEKRKKSQLEKTTNATKTETPGSTD